MSNNALSAPFPWFGGKRKVAPEVWRRLGDVALYVEPFAGSLDEQSFRFNTRKTNDAIRFMSVVSSVSGKRLTYKKLTNNEGKKPLKQLRMF